MIVLLLPALLLQTASPERRVMLTGFDRVRIDGPFAVTVATGGGAAARIAGDPAAVATVQLRVEGNVLIVAPSRDERGRPRSGPAPAIAVEAGRIAGVTVRGSSTVRIDRMAAPRIDLSLTGDGAITVAAIDAEQVAATLIGPGRLTLAGRAVRARITVNGPGEVAAQALQLDELLLQSSGAGPGRYRVRYAADIAASGSGSVTVEGAPRCRTRGTATIRCGQADSRASVG